MSTSTAILLGSVIIAAALYLGRQAPTPTPTVEVAPAPTPTVEAASVPTPTPANLYEVVGMQAREVLQYQMTELRRRCPTRPGEQYGFTLDVTFDAQGNEVVHGITERPGNAPGMGACVSAAVAPLRVPPPGVTIMVEVPLTLP